MSNKILGNLERGLLFVISAPAGTGKSTLIHMLLQEFPDQIAQSCSMTTREPRHGEIQNIHYDFSSLAEFKKSIKNEDFLEYALVFGHYYGTPRHRVEELQRSGKHVVLVIDTQGAFSIMGKIPAIFIFILPPSMEELERRLFKRSTESKEKIKERLEWAQKEIFLSSSYDYHIINDDLLVTYQVVRSIFIAEEHKRR